MSTIRDNITLYVKPIGSFLVSCGTYSFYWGIISISLNVLSTDPMIIKSK
jgi:hypothetical protein